MSAWEKVWFPSSASASSHMLSSAGRVSGPRFLQIRPSLTNPTVGTARAVNVASNFAVLVFSAARSHISLTGTETAGRSSNVMAIFRAFPGGVTSAPKAGPAIARERQTHGMIEDFMHPTPLNATGHLVRGPDRRAPLTAGTAARSTRGDSSHAR